MRRAATLGCSSSSIVTTRGRLAAVLRRAPRARTMMAARAAPAAAREQQQPQQPILLLDVMDTLVSDPFYEAMPRHFGMPFRDLLDAKHPTAWVEFERGEIGERELLRRFFRDGRPVDGGALVKMMKAHYRLLDGIEPLLERLKDAGVRMHACSNYPVWWRNVEEATELGRWIEWTFVSCEGPMRVE
jgi:phosphoglycolate phosphatase-like HAD superfamily hydrolase